MWIFSTSALLKSANVGLILGKGSDVFGEETNFQFFVQLGATCIGRNTRDKVKMFAL
jgi:hypothetical protein